MNSRFEAGRSGLYRWRGKSVSATPPIFGGDGDGWGGFVTRRNNGFGAKFSPHIAFIYLTYWAPGRPETRHRPKLRAGAVAVVFWVSEFLL